ncbi:MAG: hypothetical protein L3J32_01315 [Rhizobiaceae bacterium]|nr:hypothetical protein [Rhizobiaceae bacterium]
MSKSDKINSRRSILNVFALSGMLSGAASLMVTGIVAQAHAGSDRMNYSSSSAKYKSGKVTTSVSRGYKQKTISGIKYSGSSSISRQLQTKTLNYPKIQYNGPLVIKVPPAHSRKGLKARNRLKVISIDSRNPMRGLDEKIIDDGPGGVRIIYYNENRCNSGFDCVIRLGNSDSAPKIIVVGPKRDRGSGGPLIIYPPS